MPSLGADMEAGTLVEWLVKPGDQVKRGDIIAVVETQKGAIEIEIFDTGTIERILVEVGTKVPVGTPLAVVRTQAEAPVLVEAAAAADRRPFPYAGCRGPGATTRPSGKGDQAKPDATLAGLSSRETPRGAARRRS